MSISIWINIQYIASENEGSLIPGWIPSGGQCNSLTRLLITLMFVIRMLCPILSNSMVGEEFEKTTSENISRLVSSILLQKRFISSILSFSNTGITRKWEMKKSMIWLIWTKSGNTVLSNPIYSVHRYYYVILPILT